jgi:hypothetical protein
MTTAITKKKDAPNLSVVGSQPDWADELSGAAGVGLEDVRADDLSMPFFRLLQSLSPETKKSDPSHVEGASEGMWLDTVARAVYDSIIFIPSRFATHYIEWRPRSEGGGIVANHGSDRSVLARCTRDEKTGRDVTPEGNEIVATATWYGVVVSGTIDGETHPINKDAVIALSGTQQKVSRKWLSDAASIKLARKDGSYFTPPLFSMAYRLSSVPTKNDMGSWSLAAFERAGWTLDFENGRELFAQARSFSEVSKDLQPPVAGIEGEKISAPLSSAEEIPF